MRARAQTASNWNGPRRLMRNCWANCAPANAHAISAHGCCTAWAIFRTFRDRERQFYKAKYGSRRFCNKAAAFCYWFVHFASGKSKWPTQSAKCSKRCMTDSTTNLITAKIAYALTISSASVIMNSPDNTAYINICNTDLEDTLKTNIAKQELLKRIQDMRPGTRLPNRIALAKSLNVSRTTLERAISELIAMGYLSSQDGSGTYVQIPVQQKMDWTKIPDKPKTNDRC